MPQAHEKPAKESSSFEIVISPIVFTKVGEACEDIILYIYDKLEKIAECYTICFGFTKYRYFYINIMVVPLQTTHLKRQII